MGKSIHLFGLFSLVIFLLVSQISHKCVASSNINDDDFSEFEDFDDEFTMKENKPPRRSQNEEELHKDPLNENDNFHDDENNSKENVERMRAYEHDDDDEEVVVEDEETDEFSHFADEEEFIGYDGEKPRSANGKSGRTRDEPKITIAKVPLHLRSNWDSFYLEILMVAGLTVYFINFVIGKGKNQKIAAAWFDKHKTLLESNFALVGDDGKSEVENPGLVKESENIYILWCSGRTLMEGMLIELRLLKRQDLVGVIGHLLRPSSDQLIINVSLEDMDTFVFAFGTKKAAAKLAKDMTDISTYCPEKRGVDKYGCSSQFVVHSEIGEIATIILRDPKFMALISKFPELIEFFHFSDQYSGPKQQEETQATKLPQVKKMLVFGLNFPKENLGEDVMEDLKPLMQLVFYLSDKVSRIRLSKEAKAKAEKNRSKVEEAFLKATHAARAEMAQNLREEKKRKERERIMSLDDPDKQRKWEEKEQKRQMKKRTPKMKTMKIKPM